ncbi:MAG: carotenoid 1,2-hydratase [Planctomycetes bacterium]|nr:carotenoid 1,2-hydratase [Planctomycetota bacterium]
MSAGRLRLLLRAPLLLALLGFAAVWTFHALDTEPEQSQTRASPIAALTADADARFERARAPRPFEFPRDHGSHPEFQTEWWYFTGQLATDAGRRFGFELTFFRRALAFEPPAEDSAWAARDVYLAHFAITDEAGRRFRAEERFERAALGLAGTRDAPWAVWTGPWRAESVGAEFLPLVLRAQTATASLELELAPTTRLVAHGAEGEVGLSRKGASDGNASYYYSLLRLPARGTLALDGAEHVVSGFAWLDREWSTSALEPGIVGWDWFALSLDDGRDLMLYRLRREDGSAAPFSAGTLVDAAGSRRALDVADFEVIALEQWTSPHTAAVYPARWRVRVPSASVDVEVRPWLADQELALAFPYWEGACDVLAGAEGGAAIGRAYVELVGYAPVASRSASAAAR